MGFGRMLALPAPTSPRKTAFEAQTSGAGGHVFVGGHGRRLRAPKLSKQCACFVQNSPRGCSWIRVLPDVPGHLADVGPMLANCVSTLDQDRLILGLILVAIGEMLAKIDEHRPARPICFEFGLKASGQFWAALSRFGAQVCLCGTGGERHFGSLRFFVFSLPQSASTGSPTSQHTHTHANVGALACARSALPLHPQDLGDDGTDMCWAWGNDEPMTSDATNHRVSRFCLCCVAYSAIRRNCRSASRPMLVQISSSFLKFAPRARTSTRSRERRKAACRGRRYAPRFRRDAPPPARPAKISPEFLGTHGFEELLCISSMRARLARFRTFFIHYDTHTAHLP